jgi:hypothetical protein
MTAQKMFAFFRVNRRDVQVKRVESIAGRMVAGKIKGGKIMPLVFNLRSFNNVKT